MRYQLFGLICASVSLCACANEEGEETAATTQSLQILQEASLEPTSPAVRDSILRAALRLCDLQADHYGDNARNGLIDEDPDDGGWDWQISPSSSSHSGEASARNLYGATGLGLWAALQFGAPRPRIRNALLETYRGIARNSEIGSAPDIVFLSLLSDRYSDQRYARLARDRYDARVASAGSANLLAAQIRDARHAAGADGLIAYDLGWFAIGALALGRSYPGAGYLADFDAYVDAVLADLDSATPDFDYQDAHEGYYVTGLAWSMLASSWRSRARMTFRHLRSLLLREQLSGGAWPHNADYPDPNLQATAHALIALGLTKRGDAMPNLDAAVVWLTSQQNGNGGWSYGVDQEYPLLDAEAALGMYLVRSPNSELVPNKRAPLAFAVPGARRVTMPAPAAPESAY